MSAEFESERLRFRPQRMEDAAALHEAYRDEALMRYWSSGPHATIDDTEAYIADDLAAADRRKWVFAPDGGGGAIGAVTASVARPGVVEIGYILRRDQWGRGYAREAVARLLDLLFVEEGRRRVFADTDPENEPSIRLLQSLGFRREGLLLGEWETHIGVRDSVIWGLLRDEWTSRR